MIFHPIMMEDAVLVQLGVCVCVYVWRFWISVESFPTYTEYMTPPP